MSHDQNSLHRMASSTPSSPVRRDALDLPPQPGIWLDPIVTGMPHEPGDAPSDDGEEVVIEEDGDDIAATSGGQPRRRRQLPYGRG